MQRALGCGFVPDVATSPECKSGGRVFKPNILVGSDVFIAMVNDTEGHMRGLHSMARGQITSYKPKQQRSFCMLLRAAFHR